MIDNIIDARARFQALQDRSGHVVMQSVSKPDNAAQIRRAITGDWAAEVEAQMMRQWLGTRPPVPPAPMPPVTDEDDGA